MKNEFRSYRRTKMQKKIIIQKLKEQGCRVTKQRLILLDIILENDCSCCKEIFYKASRKDPGIGPATVYRMVNILEDIGAISRSNMYRIACGKECSGQNAWGRKSPREPPEMIDYHEIIECITCALEAKDPYTAGHSQRVSDMTLKVCILIGLKQNDIEQIHIAAHLHDIGKIGVPDVILNKTGRLTEEEWRAIKKHPEIGAEIIGKSAHLKELKNIVLCHHERFDGKGYPLGLAGEKIPMGSRIIAICDSIDAMTSNRSYRKAYDFKFCYEEIKKNLGKMYDPVVGEYVLKHWKEIVSVIKE